VTFVVFYRNLPPIVVTIYANRKLYLQNKMKQQQTLGSGMQISPQCPLLKDAHVVENANEMISKLFNHDRADGLLLQRVSRGSPADRAGWRGGVVPASPYISTAAA